MKKLLFTIAVLLIAGIAQAQSSRKALHFELPTRDFEKSSFVVKINKVLNKCFAERLTSVEVRYEQQALTVQSKNLTHNDILRCIRYAGFSIEIAEEQRDAASKKN